MNGRPGLVSPTAVKVALLVMAAVALVGVVVHSVDGILAEPPAPDGRQDPPPPADSMSEPGQYVVSEVKSTGDVRVAHWIVSPQPVNTITVSADQPDGIPGTVVVRDVVVSSNGKRLARVATIGNGQKVVSLGEDVEQIQLTYVFFSRIEDDGTVPGRALARITTLNVDHMGEAGRIRRMVAAPGVVLNVACLRDEASPPRPCGQATEDGRWQVDLEGPYRDDGLLAQIQME